ncbi:transcriptional regulator [Amycolatopsis acidicola]|uniref:Transcriptional regulator n=1 Tax=Amycolatopsis acidicola TaxID=2596893 RepID=A0A5N0V872_9PSEU|nr:transcriptional regulator [Amycolatopsis acidicola]KAA9162596.1 transcriptional regulator [Amycolatopsis acidicola]
MRTSAVRQPPARTVLEREIRGRRLTLGEFVDFADRFAREHGESGTVSLRHLNRLVAGRGPGGGPVGLPRPGTARLLERIFGIGIQELLEPPQVRLDSGAPGRSEIAETLVGYYGADEFAYRVDCAGDERVTSIVTRPEWLSGAVTLEPGSERFDLVPAQSLVDPRTDVKRDAEMVDAPLYRLLDIDIGPGGVSGTFGRVSFMDYALGPDLLEAELPGPVDTWQLRPRYLPDLDAVWHLPGRLCAGGVAALCAIARPAEGNRPADYALLVQRRSDRVVNGAGRLSVIPKAFHQPLTDHRGDLPIRATLLREMEEELFGRAEVDSAAAAAAAAPMHVSRLTEPMRWLLGAPGRLRLECTGFGLNLVSGNYEFAGLVVVEDEEFWTRFGGHIEANWEASGLQVYSSVDTELTAELVADDDWSNEGLFALLQGFRRLTECGGERARLPEVRSRMASAR